MRAIHINEARKILDSQDPVDLKVWEMSTGEILEYTEVVCFSSYFRGGTRKLRFPNKQIREVRDVCIFEINGLEVFL
jgi:hypothetical protein|nr:MAG TPA: hypothetical protein [Caudoviricetes sp.]